MLKVGGNMITQNSTIKQYFQINTKYSTFKLFFYKRKKYNIKSKIFGIQPVQCSIKARWCFDVKFGMKGPAIESLMQWVQTVGKDAGLTHSNATILSGAVGVPESRIELETSFQSIYEIEAFWGKINPVEHKNWCQNATSFVVDGSPQWLIYRQTDPFQRYVSNTDESKNQSQDKKQEKFMEVGESGLIMPVNVDMQDLDDILKQENTEKQQSNLPTQNTGQTLDWKGEPMKINPGDKLPFNFQ
eukprot:TRINITY_DN3009_c0_g3_i1.p1 TRINITY_DN3009_c0_g3~~TRINITY_DN3009_c0_g3_i1.p1  ORF type:complete len:244 (-),score=13.87 TRINITY_DN3009_c0_g3_i1:184-915(-)